MPARIKLIQHALVVGLTFLGFLLVLFFGLRVFHTFMRLNGHPPPAPASGQVETDVTLIRGWMTVPYIARMYQVPEKLLFDELNIPARDNCDKSLEEINKEYFPQAEGQVLEIIKATLTANQHPPPGAPPPTVRFPWTPESPTIP